jgi:Phage protein Gp138 N-terminal domain
MEEGSPDFEAVLRVLALRIKSELWTALPGVVNSWNYPTDGQDTVVAVPGVQQMKLEDDGTWMAVPMTPHLDVPVKRFGGGGFHLTHPIAQGDEGILLYAARAIDTFWQNGGSPPAARPSYAPFRMHDLSDAMFIPCRLSDKNVLPAISQTSAQLRSVDGTSYIELLPNGAGMNLVTPGQFVNFKGSDGSLHVSGNIFWNAGSTATDAAGHKHSDVTTGNDQTGAPVPGT